MLGYMCESLTCAGDGSEHPALAIFDRPRPGLTPLLEDWDAAGPSVRCNSIGVLLVPATGQHTPVSVRVHLDRWTQGDIFKDANTCMKHRLKGTVHLNRVVPGYFQWWNVTKYCT